MPPKPIPTINNLDFKAMAQILPQQRRAAGGTVSSTKQSDPPAEPKPSPRLRRTKTYDEALEAIKAKSAEIAAKNAVDYEARILQDSFPFWDDDCWRRWNIDQLCRLNFDQGLRLPPQEGSCG